MSTSLEELKTKIQAEKARRATGPTASPSPGSSAPTPSAPSGPSPGTPAQEFDAISQAPVRVPGPPSQSIQTPPAGRSRTAANLMALEPAFVGGGSMVGGAIGQAATGPEPILGMAGGAALGAAGGKAAFENMLDVARRMGVEGLPPPPGLQKRFQGMLKEATLDLGFTAAAPVVSQVLRGGSKAVLRTMGVQPEGRAIADETLERMGVELSPLQVSAGKGPEFFSKVLGRFPLLGGPMRKSVGRTQRQLLDAKDRMFLRLGPSVNMSQLGIDLNNAATGRFKAFRRQINGLYENARTLAKQNNALVPTDPIRSQATDSLLQLERRRALLNTGETLSKDSPVIKLLDRIQKLDDTLDIDQYDGFLKELDEAMNRARKDGFDVAALMEVKRAAEGALNGLTDPAAASAFQQADKTFARVMGEVFETPVAQKAGRIEKDRFRVGRFTKQGTVNPDESFRLMYNAKSAQGLQDLRKLVGPRRFQAAVRGHFDNVFESAANKGFAEAEAGKPTLGFDFDMWRNRLGIGKPDSAEFAATREAIKGTGLNMKQLNVWTEAMERTLATAPADVNTFIARRGTMGGLRSILTAMFPTAAAGTFGGTPGALGAVAGLIGVRQAGRILTSPKLLAVSRRAMDSTLELQSRRAAIRTLAESTGMADEVRESFPEIVGGRSAESLPDFEAL